MADQKLTYSIEGDATGLKKASAILNVIQRNPGAARA